MKSFKQFFNLAPMVLILVFCFSNCYYNPFVQSLLNPKVSEDNNSFLALLGLTAGGSNLTITGQIRDPNGVALVGLVLLPEGSSPHLKSITPPYTTDAGGRFYIPYQQGSLRFNIIRDGLSFFTLILNVSSPNSIAFETTGAPPGLEILNLGSYNSSEPPRFFELVDSVPKHNTSVSSFSGNFEFIFSEAPIAAIETGPLVTTWISENVEISPPVSFDNFMNVNGNSLSIAPMSLPPFVTYTLKLKPGIKAASGLSLTERSITFTYNPL